MPEPGRRRKARPAGLILIRIGPVLLAAFLLAADEGSFSGRVKKVFDGDSLVVSYGAVEVEVRLYAIDAPEKGQPYYIKAKEFTASLAAGGAVTVIPRDRDQYQRYVSDVVLPDGKSLNAEIVRAGFAWWNKKYAPERKDIQQLEARARKEKIGLWQDPNPVPPWEWRRKLDAVPADDSAGFCASKNSKVYHRCACETVSTIKPENLVRFKTEDEAQKSGRRPCRCKD